MEKSNELDPNLLGMVDCVNRIGSLLDSYNELPKDLKPKKQSIFAKLLRKLNQKKMDIIIKRLNNVVNSFEKSELD